MHGTDSTPPESISDSVRYPVRQFITAGRAGEIVPDHSDFKQAFLDLLEGRAREPFPDGYITGEELGFYLKNQVPVYTTLHNTRSMVKSAIRSWTKVILSSCSPSACFLSNLSPLGHKLRSMVFCNRDLLR